LPAKLLRFGTFEFEPLSRELRRDGALVRLQAQPAEVLYTLLANHGQVVTRSSLREAVWGSETNVDFEGGLNFCVAQLRSILGDSADSPLYIKTVPKRGYQFIAPVTEIDGIPVPSAKPVPRSWRRVVLPIFAVCVIAIAVWYLLARPHGAVRIAVVRFENQSGDPALDRFADGLSDAMVAELTTAEPGAFEVIGNASILRSARDRQDLARIARELQARLVVLGQVQSASGTGRVLIHLIRLPDQAHLWVTRVDSPDFGNPLNTQKEIAGRAVRDFTSRLRKQGALTASQTPR
jgi:DNA-binding winged helix-turn-helix (wHTH) protein/TolB-like protein